MCTASSSSTSVSAHFAKTQRKCSLPRRDFARTALVESLGTRNRCGGRTRRGEERAVEPALRVGRRARAGVARPLRACKDGQPAARESPFLLHPMARLLTWLFRCVCDAGAARMRSLCFAFPGLPRTPSTAQDMPPRRLRSHRRVVSVDAQYSKMRPKCKAALRNFARTALVDGLATTEVSMKRQQRRCARVGRRERAGVARPLRAPRVDAVAPRPAPNLAHAGRCSRRSYEIGGKGREFYNVATPPRPPRKLHGCSHMPGNESASGRLHSCRAGNARRRRRPRKLARRRGPQTFTVIPVRFESRRSNCPHRRPLLPRGARPCATPRAKSISRWASCFAPTR